MQEAEADGHPGGARVAVEPQRRPDLRTGRPGRPGWPVPGQLVLDRLVLDRLP
ncbi:hypothetical protein OG455_26280 [Kitasatospora sp. NBC_01287]|uniref:hypothetical protein n=1 Tax=Kitasatospora sp. NBC_01287 TaxID=2903573 RepID=UPI0022585EF2|nr:hypothetical protein [Kitasatospora sp. NBC_01287]MCX4748977.1 hypothetical protein [Kitasatospora sp. NBC_01287]